MNKRKKETIVFDGLGFPVRLVNVPMKRIFDEWVIDINFNILQVAVLNILARKPIPLAGGEIRFIMDYLSMSTREFAKLFGVTHPAVIKWLNEESKMNPGTEVCLRLYILNYLQATDKEFRRLYININPEKLSHSTKSNTPLEIDAEKIAC